ncbi:glycosyltransferase family 2 protein [Psychrobacter immobilis]|uniref:glycosyltransferase family 2 protein n=1 Tax=Psychrobacter immobilis TaxID=498 RepID=UPI00191A5168|nr:glycosyltransferase family 2 protein [Psychrobacter immobilis]
MSDDRNEIDKIKTMLAELNKRVESTIDVPQKSKSLVEYGVESEQYLRPYELEDKVAVVNKHNQSLQKEVEILKEEKGRLKIENNNNTEKLKKYVKQIQDYEKRNRKFFELYSLDKEEIFKYRLLIEKLQQEIISLEGVVEKQEKRYENLKNQFSYKLGNRLVGMRKSKDILKLPKILLDDYITVKSKIKQTSTDISIRDKTRLPQLLYNGSREYTVFNSSVTLPLKSRLSTVVFNQGFSDSLDLQLYGVKPSASVDIELTIRTYQGDCTFRVMPDFKYLHHLSSDETMTINVTINDDQAHNFLQIHSANGTMEISFKKKRGVPSFIHLFRVEHHNDIVLDTDLNNVKEVSKYDLTIPKLKKKGSLFREAVDIQKEYGFETARNFLKKYTTEEQKSTINIFYANNELNNKIRWLDYINKYITDHGMHPIELTDNNKERFYCITSPVSYRIEDPTKISVIMPAYNAEKTIQLSINSILNQTWQNLELIVINDCSADRTSEIIKKISLIDSRVKFINNPYNVGAYVSKNLGLKIATGDYITGHDADDWAYPQRLEQHMQLIRSEEQPPRASNTRMIRMEENGYLPLYPFGAFCHDGVMRVASITCMFEANFLRDTLGGWDCSRFGADSEIINRCKMVIGDEFKNYKSLSMICLDEPTSLTNHPIHGVSKTSGISPTRKFYKEQWTEWHKNIDKDNVYLEFPHLERKFEVPEGTEIPEENILRAIHNVESHNESK